MNRPNIVFILTDQMRAQAAGYAGDPNVKTPFLDRMAEHTINMRNTVSVCPICTPYRACLMSGQYPLTHGLFMNDLCLPDNGNSLAQTLKREGYDTAYIGKWHLDGHGRDQYIPPERRQGFDYWKVLECSHDYWESDYYANDSDTRRRWKGYDAFSQTEDAVSWLEGRRGNEKPFILFLAFGTPHNPYDTAPKEYLDLYDKADFILRENVDSRLDSSCRDELHGYYAHISALDHCVQEIDSVLDSEGLKKNTYFIFTSDHGDSIESQCEPETPWINKQRPYDESVMVPLLIEGPDLRAREEKTLIGSPDLMPTLLGLCGVEIPDTVEGKDYSGLLRDEEKIDRDAVLLAGYSPFADWCFARGGREYRGVRTPRYTYVRDLSGPWLLFDNKHDPFQKRNLIDDPVSKPLTMNLDQRLTRELEERGDTFLPSTELLKQWGYQVDHNGAIPY